MLNVFARSNTYLSLHAIYEELGAFGTSTSIMLDDFDSVIHHYQAPVGEFAIASDYRGRVNTLYREFEKTVGEVKVTDPELKKHVDEYREMVKEMAKVLRDVGKGDVGVQADKLDSLITLVGELVIAGAGANLLARRASDPRLPSSLRSIVQLKPHQREGLAWMQHLLSLAPSKCRGALLADDMGLGKTVQALAHIATLKAADNLGAPALIICPTSVLPNWQAEITQFTPELRVVLWHGNDRQSQNEALAAADIILSSYPLLLRDQKLFAAQDFGLILFDEAQVLKNPKTAGFKAAKSLKAKQVIALSGTPVENQLTDIWSLTDLVTPGLLGPLDQFKRTIDKPITRDNDIGAKALLRRRLKPFILRRTKDEVARDLPEKTEIPEWIDLEKNQLASYESLRLLMQKRVRDEIARVGLLRSQIVFLDALLKLRQLCCDPRLVPQLSGQGAGSAKLARLLEMLPELLREGRRVLLFSQFTNLGTGDLLLSSQFTNFSARDLLLLSQIG
jgi:hypothetical protein